MQAKTRGNFTGIFVFIYSFQSCHRVIELILTNYSTNADCFSQEEKDGIVDINDMRTQH